MSDDENEFKDCEEGDADAFQDLPAEATPTSDQAEEEESKLAQFYFSR